DLGIDGQPLAALRRLDPEVRALAREEAPAALRDAGQAPRDRGGAPRILLLAEIAVGRRERLGHREVESPQELVGVARGTREAARRGGRLPVVALVPLRQGGLLPGGQ